MRQHRKLTNDLSRQLNNYIFVNRMIVRKFVVFLIYVQLERICYLLNTSEHSVTRQYGFIKFDDKEIDENFRPAQYIRLALQTDAKAVVKFMKDAWHLPTPDLIISITGGAKYSDLSVRLKKAFQLGIVSAAAATSNAY